MVNFNAKPEEVARLKARARGLGVPYAHFIRAGLALALEAEDEVVHARVAALPPLGRGLSRTEAAPR